MIPWKFSWNNVRQRPLRTLLTIFSIAGGVAAVVAVLQSAAATRGQLDSLHQTLSARATLQITSEDASAFAPEILPTAAAQPGIQAAIPVFGVFAKLEANDAEARVLAIGVDLQQYRKIRDFEFVSGRACSAGGEICLEASVAEVLHVAVGDEVRIGARGFPWLLKKKLVGILKPLGVGALEETASAFLTLSDGARLGKSPRKVTSVQLVLKPEANPDTVAAILRPLLPRPLVLVKSASAADLSQPTEDIINVGLNVAALLSVVAAIFIVINTFQISVAERRRQLALLRIVGATTKQIRKSMYKEAIAFGIAGTFAGIVAGIVGGSFLAQGMQEIFGFTSAIQVPVQPRAVLAGVLFGPLITLLAVWHPARTAADAPPMAALKSATAPHREFPFRAALLAGLVLLILAMLLFVCTQSDIFPMWTTIACIASAQIACLMFLPALIKPGAALLYRALRRLSTIEAQLGEQQLLDHFGRTVLTVSVLFIVSSVSISIGNTTLILTQDVNSWLDRTLTADFLLRASRPRVDMSESETLPQTLEPRLASIPGITFIDRMSFSLASVHGVSATLYVRELRGEDALPIDLLEGNSESVLQKLMDGEMVLGSVLAHRIQAHVGDTVPMELGGVNRAIRVAGIAKEYTSGGLMVIMDRLSAKQVYPIQAPQVYGIRTRSDAVAAAGEELRTVAREQGLIFQSLSDLRELVQQMISGLTQRFWLILMLALVIAAFAIVNTLTMNVLEQTRHLGILRVVGMSRFQVLRMFVFQALVLGLLGLLPATAVGVGIAFLITVSFRGVSDHGVPFDVNATLIGVYLACGILLSVAAAALPAVRAGRLKPLEAIHEE
jgi:putative ABC transport system permease protein